MLKDGQKQLQFAQSERNKVQSAYDALKKQWEEHFTTSGKGNKVLDFDVLQPSKGQHDSTFTLTTELAKMCMGCF